MKDLLDMVIPDEMESIDVEPKKLVMKTSLEEILDVLDVAFPHRRGRTHIEVITPIKKASIFGMLSVNAGSPEDIYRFILDTFRAVGMIGYAEKAPIREVSSFDEDNAPAMLMAYGDTISVGNPHLVYTCRKGIAVGIDRLNDDVARISPDDVAEALKLFYKISSEPIDNIEYDLRIYIHPFNVELIDPMASSAIITI